MAEEILMKTILTIVGFVVTGLLGYFVAKIKGYKEKDVRQEEALKCLLRSNITSKYYVYSELKEIPYYELIWRCIWKTNSVYSAWYG